MQFQSVSAHLAVTCCVRNGRCATTKCTTLTYKGSEKAVAQCTPYRARMGGVRPLQFKKGQAHVTLNRAVPRKDGCLQRKLKKFIVEPTGYSIGAPPMF